MISSIKSLIKNLIPFYNSYVKSRQSTIHNQTYWGYVSYRLSGYCSRGVFPGPSYLYDIQYPEDLCRY